MQSPPGFDDSVDDEVDMLLTRLLSKKHLKKLYSQISKWKDYPMAKVLKITDADQVFNYAVGFNTRKYLAS